MNRYDTLLLGGGSSESRRIVRTNLGENYNLLEAANTRQTLLLMEQNVGCIAAVLLDITRKESVDLAFLTSSAAARLLSRVPVIVITEDTRPETLDACFDLGASDVIPLDYDPYAMLRRIDTIVQLHLHKQNLEQMVQEQSRILRHSNETMVDALSSIIEYRSVESGQHILRIRRFTGILLEQVARVCPEYGLTEDQIAVISRASALHDVGKIGIPDAVLNKPGPLTEPEWETMKTHTLIGCRILESLGDMADREYLRYAHNICHYHHERWDGRGYPEGLSGEDIPICAQVAGLADAYDALTTRRVYKEAIDRTAAANMIFNGECGAFSPKLLECFRQVLPRFEELSRAYADGLSPKTEALEVKLPGPAEPRAEEGIHALQGQYHSLLHYINGLLLELWVDRGYFQLRYNPYPEFSALSRASDFQELRRITLEQIVSNEDRDRMAELLGTGIEEFLRAGMRRQSFRFSLRGRSGGPEDYDLTLLRSDVNQKENRSVTVLCRKLPQDGPLPAPREIQPPAVMAGSAFCCQNDRDLTLVRLSSGVGGIAGYSLEQLQRLFGGRLMELVHPEDRENLVNTIREQLSRGVGIQTEFRVLPREGAPTWVMFESRLIPEDGREYLYSYMTDISDTHRANEALRQKIARYEIILAQTENALFEWNVAKDTISFSDTWQTIFGLAPVSGNIREHLWEAAAFHPDDMPLLQDTYGRLQNGSAYEMVETRIAAPGGRYLWCRIRASAIREETGELRRIVGVIINIDAEKRAERALQDRAERDALTKLLNKDEGRRQAEAYLDHFPKGANCALLIIDLDNFKTVNDRYGHLFGDMVLTRAAREIRNLFRARDIVARIGGDEFMVLMRGASSLSLVENRCQRLLSVFRTAFRETEQELPISCSIGVALAPDHGTTYLELFRRADRALYRAKDRGRNTWMVWGGEDSGLLSQSPRITAVSNRIDSDDLPDLADEGIVPYAFRRLYDSRDMDATIRELLALVGRQTNVSRVYVFENSPDNRFCSNTYEWCGEGVAPEIGNLQNVSYETDIPDYRNCFNEDGIFCCSDIRELPKNLYDILAPQGIRSILHCAILENGEFRGYMGFDDCREYRMWTREQVDLLTDFSNVLSVFLLKMRCQQRLGEI